MKQVYFDQVRAFITKDWEIDIPDTIDAFLDAAASHPSTVAA